MTKEKPTKPITAVQIEFESDLLDEAVQHLEDSIRHLLNRMIESRFITDETKAMFASKYGRYIQDD